ncbi:Uncharacterized protein APZ42_006133, partial [Daphnia magna]
MNVGFFVLFFCTTRRSGSTMEDPLVYGRNHVTPVSKADPGSTSRDNSKVRCFLFNVLELTHIFFFCSSFLVFFFF